MGFRKTGSAEDQTVQAVPDDDEAITKQASVWGADDESRLEQENSQADAAE